MMGGMQTLTPEQQETANKLNAEFTAATTGLRQEIMNKRTELNAQINGTTPDATKIEALSKEIGALQGKLLAERASLNAKLTKAGVPPMGQGMMNGGMMGQGSMGMQGQNHMEMEDMGTMMRGADGGNHGHNQPAGGQHNQSGHRM